MPLKVKKPLNEFLGAVLTQVFQVVETIQSHYTV